MRRPKLTMAGGFGDAAVASPAPLVPLMTPKDVARFLGYDVRTVRRLVQEGHLQPARIAGKRTLRFVRAQVEALVDFEKKRNGSGGSTPPASSTP